MLFRSMGAVAVAQEIHDAIVERGPRHQVEFFHGYTYSAHPAACAAGLATLAIYQGEKVFERAHELAPYFLDRLFELGDLPGLVDIRGYGLLAALELEPTPGSPGLAGYEVQKRLLRAGLHLKATGDSLLVAPPYVAERRHIDELVSVLRDVLSARA